MSSERNVVASCLKSREAYERIAPVIEKEGGLSEQSKIILGHVGEYYNRDPEATAVDRDLLIASITRGLPNPKHQKMFADVVASLCGMDVSPANVVHDFVAVRREYAAGMLATALASGKPHDEVAPLIEEYEKWKDGELPSLEESVCEVLQGTSIVDLVAARNKSGSTIQLLPQSLNERLDGGLLRGHHVVIFARPEVGKTMFVVNSIYGFLRQGLRVLYIGNEDPLDDIVVRVVSRLSDMTKAEILDDPAEAETRARSKGYDNLVLASLTPGTAKEIEALVVEYAPDVLIVDQLRNILTGQDNFTRSLEQAALAVRQLGKKYGMLTLSVTQAGDSASGKAILDMGDVDSSNTGIPAQADVMVGIGMSREDELAGRRVISLPKNKPGSNHDSFPVRVEPSKSKVLSQ